MAIEAAIWRDQQRQKQDTALAWRVAAYTRAKRLPSLKQLLSTGPAKPLRGAELEKRRQEFQDMKKAAQGLDVSKLLKKRKAETDG